MRKLLSGLAIAALVAGMAQAQPGGGNGKSRNDGGNARADQRMERGERQAERRAERQPERADRQQERRSERQAERRAERQPERPQQRQAERRLERQQERRAERQQDRGAERRAERRVERPQERRQQPQAERRAERQEDRQAERRAERQVERNQRQADRRAEGTDRNVDRNERRAERQLLREERRGGANRIVDADRAQFDGPRRRLIEGCPPGLAKRNNGCMPPGLARQNSDTRNRAATAGAGMLAAALSPRWFGYDDYGPDYRYYDGYLLRTSGDNVVGYVPLLGGALAPGRPWQPYYDPAPIPAYWTDYYGIGSVDRYRYYDNVIFGLGSGYSEIDEIVALLTGDPWAVGRPMPYGYDVYNVPYAYRTRYSDTRDHWYRYSDGYIYDIDPSTRLVVAVLQLLGGGMPTVGQPWLASYQPAPIPPYWTDYYGLETADRYRYYDDVIYELDSGYGEIDAIVAVTAGDPWSVGDRMPYGYDVYNVPYSYRERYYDTPDHWYRYSDGYIYDIDPTTRLVLAAVQLLA